MKRLRNIESKNKDQLDATKDQEEKQLEAIKGQGEKELDAIEKQKKNKLKIIEKYKRVYLENKIDKLFEMYPRSFNKQSKTLLTTVAKNECKINYKNLLTKLYSFIVNFMKLVF